MRCPERVHVTDPFREIEGDREHGQDGDKPALMPRMSDLSSLTCTRAVNTGTGDFGTSPISCNPSGPRNPRHNSGSKNECGGPDRLPGVVGPRPMRRPPAPNDPIGKLALASVAHRPDPGRSEQVRRLGPGPYFQFGPPASAKKYDGRSRETDRAIKTGTSTAKSYRFDTSFYLVDRLRMQFRQHNHRNKDNHRSRQ